jgi:hypothetical protein
MQQDAELQKIDKQVYYSYSIVDENTSPIEAKIISDAKNSNLIISDIRIDSENENIGISKLDNDNSLIPNEPGMKKKINPMVPVNDQTEIAFIKDNEFDETTIFATFHKINPPKIQQIV